MKFYADLYLKDENGIPRRVTEQEAAGKDVELWVTVRIGGEGQYKGIYDSIVMDDLTVTNILDLLNNANYNVQTFRINSIGETARFKYADGGEPYSKLAIWGQLMLQPQFKSNSVKNFELMICHNDLYKPHLYLEDVERHFPNIQRITHSSQFNVWATANTKHTSAYVERVVEPTVAILNKRGGARSEEIDFWTGESWYSVANEASYDDRTGKRNDHKHSSECKPEALDYLLVGRLDCPVESDIIISGKRFVFRQADGQFWQYYNATRDPNGSLVLGQAALPIKPPEELLTAEDQKQADYNMRLAKHFGIKDHGNARLYLTDLPKLIEANVDPLRLQCIAQQMAISLGSLPYSGQAIAPFAPEQYPPYEQKQTPQPAQPAWKKWLIPAALGASSFAAGLGLGKTTSHTDQVAPPTPPAITAPAR